MLGGGVWIVKKKKKKLQIEEGEPPAKNTHIVAKVGSECKE